jgi:hypothetical protein
MQVIRRFFANDGAMILYCIIGVIVLGMFF